MSQELSHARLVNPDSQTVFAGKHTQDKEEKHGGYTELGAHFGHQYGYKHKE